MRYKYIIYTALIVLIATCLFQSCDKDCPVCPEIQTPGSYYVYFADNNGIDTNYIWIADSKTDSIIDSIITSSFIQHIDVSSDGNYLIVTKSSDSIIIYDLGTQDIVSRIYRSSVTGQDMTYIVGPENHILVNSHLDDNIQKYDILSGELIDEDTAFFSFNGKYNNSPYIYGTRFQYDYNLHYIFNYETMETIKQFAVIRPDGSIPHAMKMALSADEKYFYFIIRPDKIFKYEIATDSIIDSLYIINGGYWGDLKCTPDGKYLLVSEVPHDGDMMGPYGTFLIVGLDKFSAYRRVSTFGIIPPDQVYPALIGEIVITPDASKSFVGKTQGFGSNQPISINLIDFSTSAISGYPGNGVTASLAVGKKIIK
ncbi:MAG: WD40 repeat domain-containing protein [candidate division Zixibacteria bacterium]|nr:WD40 repeat domain-containing protein [candidate division Zixibacteria bacterium]